MKKPLTEERAEDKVRAAALIASLVEGEQSGPAAPFDFGRFLEEKQTAPRG